MNTVQEETLFNPKELLEELGNDKDVYNSIIEVFIHETKDKLKELEIDLSNLDFKNIFQDSHYIKGAAGNVTANRIYDLAFKLELAGKERKSEELNYLFKKLLKEFDNFVKVSII